MKRGLLITAACLASSGVANAQQLRIEEIIVTAKQREENLQVVPLAITAFTADDLQRRSINDIRDLAAFTPSFSFYGGSGRQDPTALVVRGVSPQTSDERYQGLSVFIDGVYIAGQLTSVDLTNLERVEVIKGPQSATFGRSTYSGAIDYVTATPKDDSVSGRIRTRMGSEDGNFNYLLTGRLNFPVVAGKLWASVNGTIDHRDELWKSPGRQLPIGEEDTKAVGGTLYAEFSDSLNVKARIAYDRDEDSVPLVHIIEPAEWEAAGVTSIITRTGQRWVQGKLPEPTRGITGGGEFLKRDEPFTGGRQSNRWFGSLVANYRFADGHVLTYTGGYFYQRYEANADFFYRSATDDPFFRGVSNPKARALAGTATAADLALVDANAVAFQEEFENQSHQLRLVSPGDQRFRYKAGLYYTKEWDRNFRRIQATAANPSGRTRGDEYIQNYAAFGGADYDIVDPLTFSVEARVAREKVFAIACPSCITRTFEKDFTNTQFTPRVTLTYRPTDATMIYVLWSRGYKPARHNTTTALPTAEPERLDNYEIGNKNTLFDGRAILNIAAFYNRVTNQQGFIPLVNPAPPPPTLTGTGNFGRSRVYGFEAEGSVILAEGWSVSGGIGYAHQKFLDPVAPLADAFLFPVGGTFQGKTTVNTPRWTGNISTEYAFPIFDDAMEMRLRADMSYVGKRYVDLANLAYVGAAARVNARITVGTEAWEVSVFGRDLGDNRTALGGGLSGSSACLFTVGARCQFLGIPRGRELGVEAILNF